MIGHLSVSSNMAGKFPNDSRGCQAAQPLGAHYVPMGPLWLVNPKDIPNYLPNISLLPSGKLTILMGNHHLKMVIYSMPLCIDRITGVLENGDFSWRLIRWFNGIFLGIYPAW